MFILDFRVQDAKPGGCERSVGIGSFPFSGVVAIMANSYKIGCVEELADIDSGADQMVNRSCRIWTTSPVGKYHLTNRVEVAYRGTGSLPLSTAIKLVDFVQLTRLEFADGLAWIG